MIQGASLDPNMMTAQANNWLIDSLDPLHALPTNGLRATSKGEQDKESTVSQLDQPAWIAESVSHHGNRPSATARTEAEPLEVDGISGSDIGSVSPSNSGDVSSSCASGVNLLLSGSSGSSDSALPAPGLRPATAGKQFKELGEMACRVSHPALIATTDSSMVD